jgi:predicted DNA binding CopG/RHH family protein
MSIKQVIPRFTNEAEEAKWWDSHRSDVEAEIRRRVQRKPLTLTELLKKKKPSQPITLRIAKEDLETARHLAAQRGLGYQTYIKMLLRDALAEQVTGIETRNMKARGNGKTAKRMRSSG